MKNFIGKYSLLLIGLSLQMPFSGLAFTDVPETNTYFNSIQSLTEKGIINGYPDNTFRPDSPINRAELLKIAFLSVDQDTYSAPKTPFSDIIESSWYERYVNTAYDLGIIQGYSDNTFRPEQYVTKAEAIKIIAEVQKWSFQTHLQTQFNDVLPADWHFNYINQAAINQYISPAANFYPNTNITRGAAAEIISRSLQQEILANHGTIPRDTFSGISLDQDIPDTYYRNEIYQVQGSTTENVTSVTAFITTGNESPEAFDIATATVINGRFTLNIPFNRQGQQKLGIIPGTSGKSKIMPISILTTINSSSSNAPIVTDISEFAASFSDDKTSVKFSSTENHLTKIHFQQGQQKKTYLTRQPVDTITIDYRDFQAFQEGPTDYYIEKYTILKSSPLTIGDNSQQSSTKNFNAVTHTFSEIKTNQIQIQNLPELLQSPKTATITGTAIDHLDTTTYITLPSGQVLTGSFTTQGTTSDYHSKTTLDPGGTFSLTHNINSTGTYIFEINDQNGIPVLNHPVYVGQNIIPLIPDYLDLTNHYLSKDSIDLTTSRNTMLQLINNERSKLNLQPITTTPELNALAQSHASDMADNDYFSHINLQGQTPDQRRTEAGITTPVSENIAFDTTVTNAHYSLMRSGSHRSNILTPEWSLVGLGIAQNSDGQLYVAQEFSSAQLNQADLMTLESDILDEINQLRTDNNKQALTTIENLSNAAQEFNNIAIQNNGQLTQENFQTIVSQYDINGQATALGGNSSTWQQMITTILDAEKEQLTSQSWQKVGLNLQMDNVGNFSIIIILN
ncbi:hypothetical protein CVV38_04480 [Candidatus Peregrinibacteria bacterium HGW-Peregrinibacteria-1]|jgi:uncharacterized protein YkwD|nr:MAG: hypothetical protein CVV38_04480 [Candidatus Peregrinibacteria bacterium HGW-Peregrinibacteria-1]